MYSLSSYASMFADATRMTAYASALRQALRPGDVVLEVGTGPGLFAVHAARLGARKVYALDPSPAVTIAREIVHANGVADRVEVMHARLEDVDLPERVDVVISDLRGILPPHGNHFRTVMLARDRDLRPGGTLIPGRDRLHVGIACAPDVYQRFVGRWSGSCLGVELGQGRHAASSTLYKVDPAEVSLVSDDAIWATLDYRSLTSMGIAGEAALTVSAACEGHGLLLWFDTTLVEGVGYSTAPDQPKQVYGLAFLPWERPIALESGSRIAVKLRADLIGAEYTWSWATRIGRNDCAPWHERFEQSTFKAQLLTREQLARAHDGHMPRLSPEGEVERFILAAMDGTRTNADIARALIEAQLSIVLQPQAARRRVADVVDRLGR